MGLTVLDLLRLQDALARTHEVIRPGRRMRLRRYVRRRLQASAGEFNFWLFLGEFVLWVDGQPVTDPHARVWLRRGSQVALYRQVGQSVQVIATGIWENRN